MSEHLRSKMSNIHYTFVVNGLLNNEQFNAHDKILNILDADLSKQPLKKEEISKILKSYKKSGVISNIPSLTKEEILQYYRYDVCGYMFKLIDNNVETDYDPAIIVRDGKNVVATIGLDHLIRLDKAVMIHRLCAKKDYGRIALAIAEYVYSQTPCEVLSYDEDGNLINSNAGEIPKNITLWSIQKEGPLMKFYNQSGYQKQNNNDGQSLYKPNFMSNQNPLIDLINELQTENRKEEDIITFANALQQVSDLQNGGVRCKDRIQYKNRVYTVYGTENDRYINVKREKTLLSSIRRQYRYADSGDIISFRT